MEEMKSNSAGSERKKEASKSRVQQQELCELNYKTCFVVFFALLNMQQLTVIIVTSLNAAASAAAAAAAAELQLRRRPDCTSTKEFKLFFGRRYGKLPVVASGFLLKLRRPCDGSCQQFQNKSCKFL